MIRAWGGSWSARRGLLDEVGWGQTDDLSCSSLEALTVYVRTAADRAGESVAVIFERTAGRHSVTTRTALAP